MPRLRRGIPTGSSVDECYCELTVRPIPIRPVLAPAERLPFPDGSVDAVLASCVFCSIPDVDGALSEVARVLDADGEVRFFEHVRSPGVVGRSQDLLTPAWRRFGGNCHLDREFLPRVEAHAGLGVVEAERHTSGHYPIREFVRGRATPSR